MFLLDTNHCSYAILGNPQILNRLSHLGDASIATCTIVKGELIDMATRFQQQQAITLVTTDQDFQRIQAVQPFSLTSWL
jgi:predicted nucleic acid-binding protein